VLSGSVATLDLYHNFSYKYLHEIEKCDTKTLPVTSVLSGSVATLDLYHNFSYKYIHEFEKCDKKLCLLLLCYQVLLLPSIYITISAINIFTKLKNVIKNSACYFCAIRFCCYPRFVSQFQL
jgi:hypothetical protein